VRQIRARRLSKEAFIDRVANWVRGLPFAWPVLPDYEIATVEDERGPISLIRGAEKRDTQPTWYALRPLKRHARTLLGVCASWGKAWQLRGESGQDRGIGPCVGAKVRVAGHRLCSHCYLFAAYTMTISQSGNI
jgi:hypothetical protein